jgi:hypothetical protein
LATQLPRLQSIIHAAGVSHRHDAQGKAIRLQAAAFRSRPALDGDMAVDRLGESGDPCCLSTCDSADVPSSRDQIQNEFFPFFQDWFHTLLHEGPGLSVRQYRFVAAVIGAAQRRGVDSKAIDSPKWGRIVELVRAPQRTAQGVGVNVPKSRGRWDGQKGYRAQLDAIGAALSAIAS